MASPRRIKKAQARLLNSKHIQYWITDPTIKEKIEFGIECYHDDQFWTWMDGEEAASTDIKLTIQYDYNLK